MGFVNTSFKALVADATNLSPEEAEVEPRSAVSAKREDTSPGSDEGSASDSISEGSQENKVGVSINLTRDFGADEVGSMGAFDGRDIDLAVLAGGRFDDSEIRGASCLLKMRDTGREVNVLGVGSTENSGEEKSADVTSIGGDVLAVEERYECLLGNEEEVDDTTVNLNVALKETSEINENEEEEDLDEGLEFSVRDFVWGKIKSHPWWPGQIFDPSDASEYALKLQQRKRLLVAYFGDGTFAWCHPSQLKPFEDNFEEMSRQSNLKSFHNAVEEAIDDIGRIMEWKMICSCIPKEHCDGLDQRYVLNAGIKEGVLLHDSQISRAGVPLEPTEILDEVKGIACGTSINSFLRLKKLTSHLSALYRSRGGLRLPIYQEPLMIVGLEDTSDSNAKDLRKLNAQGPFEEDLLSSALSLKFSQPNKSMLQNCESASENWRYQRRKKKSMAEIMDSDYGRKGISEDKSFSSTKRRKSSVTDNLEKEADSRKEAASKEKYCESGQSDEEQIDQSYMSRERKNSKYLMPSFSSLNKGKTRIDSEEDSLNISERIAKAASNIARSSPILRLNDEMFQESFVEDLDLDHKRLENLGQQKPEQNEYVTIDPLKVKASSEKVLSEVRLVALNPLYPLQTECLETVEDFLPFFRSSIYRNGSCYKLYNKRLSGVKRKNPNLEQGSLCKDQDLRVAGPSSEKVRKSKKVKLDEAEQKAGSKAAKSAKSKLKKVDETPKLKMDENSNEEDDSPALLFVTFDPGSLLPSKLDLLKLYSKFGSLDEAETEMNHQNLCAKVVFHRISDGEEAFNSSQKVNPFEQSKATFRLRYSPPPLKTQARNKQLHPGPSLSAKQSSEGNAFQSQLQFIKQELEKLTSMLENSDGEASPEMKLKLQGEMKRLLNEVSRMASHSLLLDT